MTQTNETQRNEKENKQSLEILIGDDLFGWPAESMEVERGYLHPLRNTLSKDYNARITQASTPEQMLAEASKGVYDLIISDLDYQTTGRVGTEGYGVFDSINVMALAKKPFRVLCTSSDNQKDEIESRIADGRIDAYVGAKSHIKFKLLVDFVINKYQTKQRAPEDGSK